MTTKKTASKGQVDDAVEILKNAMRPLVEEIVKEFFEDATNTGAMDSHIEDAVREFLDGASFRLD